MDWLKICLTILCASQVYCGFFDSIKSAIKTATDSSIDYACSFTECCRKVDIPADFDGLKETLNKKVYGQHLVNSIIEALRSHWEDKPKKALALSFHGWPGGGKNYVANFIAKHLYRHGVKSKFVHSFIGRLHFPRDDFVEQYKENLYQWIKGNTSLCSKQLFIFDEVDKMPSNLLNIIKPLIDYRENVEGVDYREAIFIFLSNTGENLINAHYLQHWRDGTVRESLRLADFESLIIKGAFSEKGGLHMSDNIKNSLIDHYIPFLPMELSHVKLCIMDEFHQRGIHDPKKEHIQLVINSLDWSRHLKEEKQTTEPPTGILKVFKFFRDALDIIEWGPEKEKAFSKTGCKRVSQKVGFLVGSHYRNARKQEL